ncbi:mitochondrial calcium uniporter regulator 1 isoform X1 [Mirounga angustirostris]|uniref:mitochondrial calcium uniporter regulator 1 isoform X1 n=1 Tax=Mirounga angustirostris TaxID=9716 RepID=UPI001E689B80|nr:mitochondrial calcium uniporter regulator 1 isoform X1 [Mirounga angustirostris]XP_054361703.1 mitochondrial calcium uniporter regulator 1 isoform X1 [Mirounga angustirostris]XP_054361704.1 mitochondrial calcium uniporter regulator 1 isoform X1 [Mirounga angustirostris]
MDCGFVAGGRPKSPPGRRRLLVFLPSGRCGSPGGRGVSARHCPSALSVGLGALRFRGPAARGGASRASPLLLLLLVPSPRLAAVAPRRPLADRESSRPRPSAPAAGRGGAGRYLAGLAPGLAWAAGALHLCRGRVAALASSRRELSLSAGSLQLEHSRDLDHKRRDFTSFGNKKLYFDTHALVCLLEENGFSTQQAEITVSALVKITDANMDIVYKDMVTKMQQEITVQQIMSQIASVKKDMIILEKSEFSALRAENEKINVELHRLKQQIMDEVVKVRTDTKLDFNLEKSRVKELYSLNERKLLEMRTEMVALHAQQDRAVTQTDRKIDTEVAGLKTMLESHKLDNIKYLAVAFVPLSGGGQNTEDPTQPDQ